MPTVRMTCSAANPRVRNPLDTLADLLVPFPQATYLFRSGKGGEPGKRPTHILVVDRSYPVTLGADAILERDGRLFRGKVSEGSDVWGIVTWELIRRC